MNLLKNLKIVLLLLFFVMVGGMGAVYSITHEQIIRTVFISSSSDFVEIQPHVFLEKEVNDKEKEKLLSDLSRAKERVYTYFGEMQSTPVIVLCTTPSVLKNYANGNGQTYDTVLGNYIVLGPEGLNEDILAHELTHAELHKRSGRALPAWFDEGLATMVDKRFQHSMNQVWAEYTSNHSGHPDWKSWHTQEQFRSVNENDLISYQLAAYEVSRWYIKLGKAGLLKLLHEVNKGTDFYSVYEFN